jgi:predicted RNase H-like HicB family nuclease
MNFNYPIIIEKSEEGYYAECPFISGAYTQGDSEEEVIENLKEVIIMTLEDMRERGENISFKNKKIPSITLSSISLTV